MAEQWVQLLFETCEKGVSSAVAPELLPDTQVAWGGNITARGGKPHTRPAWALRADLPRGLIQGGEFFGIQGGMMVVSISGKLYRIRINNRHFDVEEIPLGFDNSGVIKQVWMCQTVETLVIQDGQSDAILYDGSTAERSTGNQVPRGKMMAYGNGRLWLAINDKELIAGNIRTRSPGSELIFTETNYLTGGGSLYFPRGLTGLSFIPVTGQADYGALLSYGLDYSKAIRADVTQRDQWASIPGFEQSILNSVGSAGQWPIVSVNQDLYWRDSNGGIRSIRNALADEQGPGSSPVSREVSRLTDYDSQQLMPWCSGVYHDNRLLMTSSPYLLPNGGVGWKNLIALDFAPLSTLQGKSQAAYDGQWSGLSIVKLLGGSFNNKNRAFALTSDVDGHNQLWETGSDDIADMTGLCDAPFAKVAYPIRSWVEYPRRNFGVPKQRKRIERCDVWLSNVDGALDLAVYWRADNSQQWLKWDEATTCAQTTDASTATPHVWKNLLTQERPQFKTFTIPQEINELVGYAAEVGFEFQIRLVWTGYAQIHRMMTYATVLEDPNFAMRDEFQAACIENNVSGNEVEYVIPTYQCREILVSQGSTDIESGDDFSMGNTADAPIDTVFTITNFGGVDLTLGVIASSDGNFTILHQPAITLLPPHASTTFTVRFALTTPLHYNSNLVIPNDGVSGNFHFSVSVVPAYSPITLSDYVWPVDFWTYFRLPFSVSGDETNLQVSNGPAGPGTGTCRETIHDFLALAGDCVYMQIYNVRGVAPAELGPAGIGIINMQVKCSMTPESILQAMGGAFIIKQGDRYYEANYPGTIAGGWLTYSFDATNAPGDWLGYFSPDGAFHAGFQPDFSASGEVMYFGLLRSNTSLVGFTVSSLTDDWVVTINPV